MADAQMAEFLNGVIGVVDANSYERLCLWQEWQKPGKSWKENTSGFLETVGHLDGRPVCVSMFTATVDGHRLLFLDATSQVVDHKMIDEWLQRTMPQSAFRDNGYVNRVDAMNFTNIFPRVFA